MFTEILNWVYEKSKIVCECVPKFIYLFISDINAPRKLGNDYILFSHYLIDYENYIFTFVFVVRLGAKQIVF